MVKVFSDSKDNICEITSIFDNENNTNQIFLLSEDKNIISEFLGYTKNTQVSQILRRLMLQFLWIKRWYNMFVKEELIKIYNALNTIPVNGSNVFTMAGIMNTISEIINGIDLKDDGGDK